LQFCDLQLKGKIANCNRQNCKPPCSESADYVWRLIPANPILVRVVETRASGGSTFSCAAVPGDFGGRSWLFSIASGASGGAGSLADLAKSSAQLFVTLKLSQLALVCFWRRSHAVRSRGEDSQTL